ncbi:MAG: hypothetical protein PWP24_1293 [Clostridiales bacterium]|nr:hypothetical protein [Clostridiales bacterium]
MPDLFFGAVCNFFLKEIILLSVHKYRKKGKNMRLCELSCKEVINVCDGKKLGYIEDIEFEVCSGCIRKVIIPGPCKIWGILGHDQEYVIDYNCIEQIGPDVVLVRIDAEKCFAKCKL